jgi:hypothetical protein
MGPTILIGVTPILLDLCFLKNIFEIFSIHHFKIFKKNQSFVNTIMLMFIYIFTITLLKKHEIVFCVFLMLNYCLKALVT